MPLTVGELEAILSQIKDKSIIVVMDCGEGFLEDVCPVDSGLITIMDEETGEDEELLSLTISFYDSFLDDLDDGEINSRPELN